MAKAEDISKQAAENVEPNLKALEEQKKNIPKAKQIILWITKHVGSVGFFVSVLVLMAAWFSWNTFTPKKLHFDTYPVFVEWALISSTIQLLLLPLILRGQKLESQEAHLRAEADLEISKQIEKENEAILRHLEEQDKWLAQLASMNKQLNELVGQLKQFSTDSQIMHREE